MTSLNRPDQIKKPTSRPSNACRDFADVDAENVLSPNLSKSHILAVLAQPEGYVENGRDLQIYLDENYNNSLGPLHEDYRERAVPLRGFDCDKPIQVFVAAGVDLAISKLGRFAEHDQTDIEGLIEAGRVDVEEFVNLATEAIDYAVGNKSGMLSCLRLVTEKYVRKHGNETPEQ